MSDLGHTATPDPVDSRNGFCHCGHARFLYQVAPLFRFYCHCLVCQAFYKQPYADVTMVRASDLHILDADSVKYRTHRPPPALKRAECAKWAYPVASFLRTIPFVQVASVPTMNIPDKSGSPEPSFHIFYHRRVEAVDDDLPKYSGYWASEWAAGKHVMSALSRRPGRN